MRLKSCAAVESSIQTSYSMQGQANPPKCDRCRKYFTVKHIMVKCKMFVATHEKYYNLPTLSNMLADSCSVFKTVVFLQEIDIVAKIYLSGNFRQTSLIKKHS